MSITDAIKGFNTQLGNVCTTVQNNLSTQNLNKVLTDGISLVFENAVNKPIVLTVQGASTVIDTAGNAVNSTANTVGDFVNNTLSTLNGGVSGLFTGLNNLANGTFSLVDTATKNLNTDNLAQSYRYQSTANLFNSLNTTQQSLTTTLTSMQTNITNINVKASTALANPSISQTVKNNITAFQSSLQALNNRIPALSSSFSSTVVPSLTTLFNQNGMNAFQQSINANTVSDAQATSLFNTIKTNLQTTTSLWTPIASELTNLCAPILSSYTTLADSYAAADQTTKNNVLEYIQSADATQAICRSLLGTTTDVTSMLSRVGIAIVLPGTESFDFVDLPFTKTTVDGFTIFQYKTLPLLYATKTENNMNTYYVTLDKTIYYMMHGKGVTIEYLNTPYLQNSDPLQMYVISFDGIPQPLIYSNYPIQGMMFPPPSHREYFALVDTVIGAVNEQVVNPALGWITQLKDKAVSSVQSVLQPIRQLVNTLVVSVNCVVGNVNNVVTQIGNFTSTDSSKNPIFGAMNSVWANSQGTFNTLVGGISTVGNRITTNANNIKTTVVDKVKGTWNNTAAIFGTTINGVVTTIQTIESKVRELITFIVKIPGQVGVQLKSAATSITGSFDPNKIIDRLKAVILADPPAEPFAFPRKRNMGVFALLVVILLLALIMVFMKGSTVFHKITVCLAVSIAILAGFMVRMKN